MNFWCGPKGPRAELAVAHAEPDWLFGAGRHPIAKQEKNERREIEHFGDLNLFESVRAMCPYAIAAIRLLILTGCRSAEILGLRWEDVDFERKCLRLPDSKTGKRTVLLNEPSLKILASLEPQTDNPYVVPGEKAGSHRSTLQPVWERIRGSAGPRRFPGPTRSQVLEAFSNFEYRPVPRDQNIH